MVWTFRWIGRTWHVPVVLFLLTQTFVLLAWNAISRKKICAGRNCTCGCTSWPHRYMKWFGDPMNVSWLFCYVLGEYPWDLVKKAWELGLINNHIPADLGGTDLSVFASCVIAEEMAWGMTTIWSLQKHQLIAFLILCRMHWNSDCPWSHWPWSDPCDSEWKCWAKEKVPGTIIGRATRGCVLRNRASGWKWRKRPQDSSCEEGRWVDSQWPENVDH